MPRRGVRPQPAVRRGEGQTEPTMSLLRLSVLSLALFVPLLSSGAAEAAAGRVSFLAGEVLRTPDRGRRRAHGPR